MDLAECSIAYVPVIGYLLVVDERLEVPALKQGGVELVYSVDGSNYYKTKLMAWLDEEFGDLKMQIVDTETSTLLKWAPLTD